jgi:hypothetical protein
VEVRPRQGERALPWRCVPVLRIGRTHRDKAHKHQGTHESGQAHLRIEGVFL